MKNIDTVPLSNIGVFIFAKFGNEKAIIEMAIKYLIAGNFEKAATYINYIDKHNLDSKYPMLAEYYHLCLDNYDYVNYCDYQFSSIFDQREYAIKWHLTKRAIKDNLISKLYQLRALSMTIISDNELNDFLEYLYSNIIDKYDLFLVLIQRTSILHKALLFGYQKGFLDFDNLIEMSSLHESFAKASVTWLQDKEILKSVSDKQLLNWSFKLGERVSSTRYECGLICLQLSDLEKASCLLSRVDVASSNYANAMKEYADILYTNTNDPNLAAQYYQKAYEAGNTDAKLLLHAANAKAKGKTPSIVDLYHETAKTDKGSDNNVNMSGNLEPVDTAKLLFSQKAPSQDIISQSSFNEAHKYYLSSRGFFSLQSESTRKVIRKASSPVISDNKRFQILKKYVDKKANFGREFRSCLLVHFGQRFISSDNYNVVVHNSLESGCKLNK